MQLKILACCISGGKQQGTLSVNGHPVHTKLFRQQVAVVWQSDILLPTATVLRHCLSFTCFLLTALLKFQTRHIGNLEVALARMQVREALMTGAMLRLPNAMPCALKAQRVEQILTELVIAHPPSEKL